MRRDDPDITLRAMGTRVSTRAKMPIQFFDPRRRAVLLIHGYNVDEDEALKVLNEFKNTLSYFAPTLRPDIFTCTWAGNWKVPALRPAAYPFMLRNARESSETLLELIQDWYARPTAPQELVIIAHSLGCRVTLEMLQAMAIKGRPGRLRRLVVVLMAAAVPTEHVDHGGALEQATPFADVRVVLHSGSDTVLSFWFGLGQTIARDGWFPEAVGLHGYPQSVRWTRTEQMRAFDHGDYWAELETAEMICELLGIPIKQSAVSGVPLATRKLLKQHRVVLAPLLLSSFG
jgi:esterase/lipase superfamily enzyme